MRLFIEDVFFFVCCSFVHHCLHAGSVNTAIAPCCESWSVYLVLLWVHPIYQDLYVQHIVGTVMQHSEPLESILLRQIVPETNVQYRHDRPNLR